MTSAQDYRPYAPGATPSRVAPGPTGSGLSPMEVAPAMRHRPLPGDPQYIALQQPRPPAGVLGSDDGVQIQLEPPGREQVFGRLEAEGSLFERMRPRSSQPSCD